jgi:hypothetical protein
MGTPDENRAVIDRAFTTYSAGDVRGYVRCYAARVRGRDLYSDGAWQTNTEVLAETETFRRSFPDHRSPPHGPREARVAATRPGDPRAGGPVSLNGCLVRQRWIGR